MEVAIEKTTMTAAQPITSASTKQPIDKSMIVTADHHNDVDPNIVVDAGVEQTLIYPIRACLLNGSKSYTLDNSKIIRWEWSKTEQSPALGVSCVLIVIVMSVFV
jgi:hypothetical protein